MIISFMILYSEWKRNFFLQADASNFVQEDLEVKDQNFVERYLENYS